MSNALLENEKVTLLFQKLLFQKSVATTHLRELFPFPTIRPLSFMSE